MSFFRRAGAEIARFLQRAADPAAIASSILLYAKDVAGITQLFARASDGTVTQLTPIIPTVKGVYGDGSDGPHTVVGTEVLTRNMYYTTLVVPNGTILEPDGYIIHASVSIVTDAGGVIRRNGTDSTLSGGAAAFSSTRTLNNNGAGAASNNGAGSNASASANTPRGMVGTGGAGGAGSGGAGGNGGAVTIIPADDGDWHQSTQLAMGLVFGNGGPGPTYIKGGPGGGGGGGNGAAPGRGGAAGGAPVLLVAPTIVNNGSIQSRGGNGANAANANTGGGGGGMGGWVGLVTDDFSGNAPDVSGGTGGLGNGTGGNGVNGSAGVVLGPIAG